MLKGLNFKIIATDNIHKFIERSVELDVVEENIKTTLEVNKENYNKLYSLVKDQNILLTGYINGNYYSHIVENVVLNNDIIVKGLISKKLIQNEDIDFLTRETKESNYYTSEDIIEGLVLMLKEKGIYEKIAKITGEDERDVIRHVISELEEVLYED